MVEEMDALYFKGTWKLVAISLDKFLVGYRWVYTVNVGHDGQVD